MGSEPPGRAGEAARGPVQTPSLREAGSSHGNAEDVSCDETGAGRGGPGGASSGEGGSGGHERAQDDDAGTVETTTLARGEPRGSQSVQPAAGAEVTMDGPDGAGGALGGDGGAGALADEGAGGAGGAEGALGEAAAERDDEDAGKAADEGGAGGGGGSARDEAAEAEAPAAAGAEGGAPDGREGAAAEAHARKIAKRARKSAAAAASAPVRRRPLSALERQAGDWRPWGQPCYFRREEQPASAFAEGELAEAAPEEEATAAAARDARERRLREEMAALAPARVAYKERAVLAQLRDAALARGTALRAPGRALGRALVAAEAAEAQLREELGSAPERELEHEESRLRAAREKARRAQEAVRATWLHPDQRTKARAAETASALRDQAAVHAAPPPRAVPRGCARD